jgi:Mn2+/Fe2+ NRAMP family transporter
MVICSLTTIVINLILIGLTFKNYKNSKLNAYANSFALNLLLDNFVARPIMSVLFAIPLSKIDAVN